MVGYTPTAYRILVDGKIYITRNVTFVESTDEYINATKEDKENDERNLKQYVNVELELENEPNFEQQNYSPLSNS